MKRLAWLLVLAPLCLALSLPPGTASEQPPAAAPAKAAPIAAGPVDFDRQIRPILSDNCFRCHGPDEKERKARLRLDRKEDAFKELRSGGYAIVPGHASRSVLIGRVTAEDPHERMPPPKTNKRLTPAQIDLLRRWIDQGAGWSEHWAFVPPKRPALPRVADRAWPRNAIDHFVLARLEAEGLAPAPQADKIRLIRRATLDLTGLPPTPAEVDAFLADQSPDAYEMVVDRLLASPHFGERMALDWLDAARYADTHGYHIDSGRDMSRWRDWVIDAFNTNKPFDRFTVEQVAGDLLPGATRAQQIASGFNRNHMINFEGGAIPAEYQNAYIVDRVNTTATVWLGLTIACAQCHDHKYDPISQKDYYRFYAFFHNVPENGLDGAKGNAVPLLRTPTPRQEQRLAELDAAIKQLDRPQGKPVPLPARERLVKLRAERAEIEKQIPTTMVMQEMARPRDTFVLLRGEYDKKGEKVSAGTPAALPPLPAGAPPDRLGLARWLVDPANPLTARVAVNRIWQLFFGTGLVKTAEDFGSQGEPPSHPELLDWLAVEFMGPAAGPRGRGLPPPWDVKALVRLIVTSATYKQSSSVAPALYARDPENRLLARGPRLRLHAEFLRDQVLAVSGLLDRRIGGPSVFPYQPAGLWQELASRGDSRNWSAQFYVQSHGRDLYRRTMYTFWKRTSPPPSLMTFDAPDRETCVVRRARTNTPLQALVLLNDPTYVEASRKLAERMMTEAGTPDERIAFAFRLATARRPSAEEVGVLRQVFERQLGKYRADAAAARKLLAIGEAPRNERLPEAELAAWTIVASMILNLDETVTKG
jgi:mono/diheme cytochrome c family protein